MAYRQPYRGNPELKQYHLINDFSGGLDTTSLDEKMRDNEFREMQNIELALQGSIQNRKGFGELKHFNQWLEDKNVTTIPTGRVNFFKIITSTKPVLKWANDYVSYSSFQSKMNSEIYELKILIASQVGNDVQFNLIKVFNTTGQSGGTGASKTTVLTLTGAAIKENLNIKTHQYVQKIYFLSYDVYTTSTAADKGILVYNLDDDTLTVLTPNDTYIPTPFEVESFGFNVLRNNPIDDVADQGFGDYSIVGAYLTIVNDDNTESVVSKIPPNGNFNFNIFQIGSGMKPQHLVVTLKNQNDVTMSYNFEAIRDDGGVFVYPVRNLILSDVTSVTFQMRENETIENVTKMWEVSKTDFGTHNEDEFHFATFEEFTKQQFPASSSLNPVRVVREDFKLAQTTVQSSFDFDLTLTAPVTIQDVYRELAKEEYQWYTNPTDDPVGLPATIRVQDGFGSIFYQATASEFSTKKYFDAEQEDSNDSTNQNFILGIQSANPITQETLLYDGQKYYQYAQYNTTNDDFDGDFVEIGGIQDILPFDTSFVIGVDENPASAAALDLDGARLTQIQDRLVFYKGNSIYFSEQFQYDYVPNLNFVLLPLDSDDSITHINFFRGAYIIFTKKSIWRMSGIIFGPDFAVVKVNDFIGCIAPDSVRALNNNLMFLSRQGLYTLTQSYYQEGLENVKKVDERISDIIPLDEGAYGVMYQEQYWLLLPEATYDTLKYYFNSPKPNGGHPFTTDTYTVKPQNLEVYNGVIYSVRNGDFYRFDKDYTDFLPRNSASSVVPDYLYTYRFVTKNDDFGYPTHDKKVKSVYFKIRSNLDLLIGTTIFINEKAIIDPNTYTATTNEYGETIYTRSFTANLTTDLDETLGSFVLGKDTLGGTGVSIHKFIIGKKGKNFSIAIEQKTNGAFNIEDIGYLFKLGKVKESR